MLLKPRWVSTGDSELPTILELAWTWEVRNKRCMVALTPLPFQYLLS